MFLTIECNVEVTNLSKSMSRTEGDYANHVWVAYSWQVKKIVVLILWTFIANNVFDQQERKLYFCCASILQPSSETQFQRKSDAFLSRNFKCFYSQWLRLKLKSYQSLFILLKKKSTFLLLSLLEVCFVKERESLQKRQATVSIKFWEIHATFVENKTIWKHLHIHVHFKIQQIKNT